ncbi:MAG: citrate transporter [Lachnospiraceae bacterium]|nr:citrate transporter [Lachnospiraceae bacterium]
MKDVLLFLKKEVVLCVSAMLALGSMYWVKPDAAYLGYIDIRTLSILLCLMISMAGLQRLNVFRQLGEALVGAMATIRGVVLVLLLLCFLSSMLITNDVALITFVPFTVVTLSLANRKDLFIPVIVLETIAANLGSMLTPLGNPQNLYLYGISHMSFGEFVMLMLPYSTLSLVMVLLGGVLVTKGEPITAMESQEYRRNCKEKVWVLIYIGMFLISLLVVLRVLEYWIGLILVVSIAHGDRRVLRKPDYSLLFTFAFLFIFIGNMKRIPQVSTWLAGLIQQNEVLVSLLLSQGISNVPAAILCSGFTTNIRGLIVGTNLGGLGTLIASMASLISFKQYGYTEGAKKGRYVGVFTIVNLLFLAALLLLYGLRSVWG